MTPSVLRKASVVDEDTVDGDLILMNVDTRQVTILNEAAAILWEAMDELATRPELAALLVEAFPDRAPAELGAQLDSLLATLLEQGFIEAEPGPAA